MLFFLLLLAACSAVFGCLFLLLRRHENGRTGALAALAAVDALCLLAVWVYRGHDSFLGLVFRHNRGLLGGYLCVLAAVLAHVIWLAAALAQTRNRP